MATNRRKHANTVPIAGIVRWVVVALFIAIAGLSYVYFKNQQHTTGSEIKNLERQLADLTMQNDVVRAKISQLSSRSFLQKRLADGFIHMTPITDDRIMRLNTAPPSRQTAAANANEIRAISNRILAK
jgi:hypothetical protein